MYRSGILKVSEFIRSLKDSRRADVGRGVLICVVWIYLGVGNMTVLLDKDGTAYPIDGKAEIYTADKDFHKIVNDGYLIRRVLESLGKDTVIMGNLGKEVRNDLYDNVILEDEDDLLIQYKEKGGVCFYGKVQ